MVPPPLVRVRVVEGWGEHLQAAARPEVQHKPLLLTHPLALHSLALASSKAPLVFPIHQH